MTTIRPFSSMNPIVRSPYRIDRTPTATYRKPRATATVAANFQNRDCRNAGQKDEDLERRGGRQHRRHRDRQHAVTPRQLECPLDPRATEPPADQRIAAAPADAVQHEAAEDGAEGRHQSVEGHPLRMLHDKQNDQQVVDLGERQERRVEEGDEKEAGPADAQREGLNPDDDTRHRRPIISAARPSGRLPCP